MNSASTLEMALFGLLRQKAQAGYDLRKTFTETAMRHYSDSPGSIYPALRRLQMRGWIEAEPKDSRGREVFHLSAEGVTAFLEWLSRDVSREDVVFRVAELMLRFAFMDGNVPRSTTIRFLEQFEREEQSLNLDGIRTRIAASIACHAAIKINMPLEQNKMQWLLTELAKTDCPMSCPHGRPVVLRYSVKDIQRAFKRI